MEITYLDLHSDLERSLNLVPKTSEYIGELGETGWKLAPMLEVLALA